MATTKTFQRSRPLLGAPNSRSGRRLGVRRMRPPCWPSAGRERGRPAEQLHGKCGGEGTLNSDDSPLAQGEVMVADDTTFGTEMRGYRKEDVDQAIQKLRADLERVSNDQASALKEIQRLLAVNEDLQAELDETGTPT